MPSPRGARRSASPIRKPGYFEQDPDEWWDSTAAALRNITDQVGAARIAAVAISNQRETFGAFAEDGTAIRPGMTWLDERARPQVSALRQIVRRRARSCHFRQAARYPALPLPHHLDGGTRAGYLRARRRGLPKSTAIWRIA